MSRITEIQYTSPTQANPIGGLIFKAEIPVFYREGETKPVAEGDDVSIEISGETLNILEKLSDSILNDIQKQKNGE